MGRPICGAAGATVYNIISADLGEQIFHWGHNLVQTFNDSNQRLLDRFEQKDEEEYFRELARIRQQTSVESYVIEFQRVAIMLQATEEQIVEHEPEQLPEGNTGAREGKLAALSGAPRYHPSSIQGFNLTFADGFTIPCIKTSNPPFTRIMLDHSDSGREGCTVTALTATAEPRNWRDALKVSVQQVRRLKEFGITKGELERYMTALLKDRERQAAMIDNVSSINNLNMIMEGHESLIAVAQTVTLEDVNATGAMLLQYISDFGKVTECLPSALVACVPKTVHEDGIGDTEFKIVPEEVTEAMIRLRLLQHPTFVPVHHDDTELKVIDKATGIVQLHLSNGVRVKYKITQNEAKAAVMTLVVSVGRASGAVGVGVRTLSESGTVGSFCREQVALFSVNHLINCTLEANEEFFYMDFRFKLREGGMQAALQIQSLLIRIRLSFYVQKPRASSCSSPHAGHAEMGLTICCSFTTVNTKFDITGSKGCSAEAICNK
eukprot:Gb_12213 [translate_table: standard]